MIDVFIGMIASFGFSFAPNNWSKCEGQMTAIAQFQALYSLLGTAYGGDGRVNFALPDLRGRTPIGQGDGPGLTSRPIGQKVGTETVTMTTAHLPSHTHTATFTPGGGGSPVNVQVSTNNGNKVTPASGDYLAATAKGFDTFNTYTDTPGTTVALGGVTGGGGGGGVVTVNNAGNSYPLPNMQPFLVINWCISMLGTYPSRN